MDKNQLKQYQDLCKEIKLLENRINKLEPKTIESDMVTGSNHHFPYQKITFHLEGEVDNSDRIHRLEGILQNRKANAEELQLQVEEFIASISDSRTRMIFEDRYIYGKSWVVISRKFGSSDESYARKVHDRFLEKLYNICYN